ncbi:hypothetical protein MVEG_00649 [Podila verticillata NRRL 6337]|nr:hypothetical protein MVEG_00649 [Podila verticillata NRRL 6337]
MSQHFLYCASGSAVEQMVRVLASQDLGRKGITVNSIASTTARPRSRSSKTFAALSPEGRIGLPDDIAGVVSFVASGQILLVNGAVTV